MSDGAGRKSVTSAQEHVPSLTTKAFGPSEPKTVTSSVQSVAWNARHVPLRVASDAASAACAAGLIAPLITILDRGVIENASGRCSLLSSVTASFRSLLTRPHTFLASRPFRLISVVYFSTYLTANSIDTISNTLASKSPGHTAPSFLKFSATSTVNMSLGLYKDSQFAQMFGNSALKRSIPTASYALFALRDSMTIFASFNLPPLVAPMLSKEVEKVMGRASLAQILAPAAVQVITTPLHLWGLDLYNRPGASLGDRARQVGKNWVGSTAARMGRIVPAFGFGGVVNAKVRRKLMEKVEGIERS
ncbi:MAG: hypothetical protein LQ338_000286 [Usnochroma carphineum]|nr:MAG: hypothetical protein LQ338_000286 [Usnochroma carphineum]